MRNPFAFTPLPVTTLISAIYLAIFTALIVVQHRVPDPPSNGVSGNWPGANLTEAWLDLKTLSKTFHPYNSRANIKTRDWLLKRIGEILESRSASLAERAGHASSEVVTILDDRVSNITFPVSTAYVNYFEGDNVAVYIRGENDPGGHFWNDPDGPANSLTLVNAHYDSVSTGYGATDDGAGVVSMLQLLSHFTSAGKQPKNGIVLLFNNAEEDGLYGAYAYTQHPISRHTRVFLNLEGTGPGGRATLFRSTDAGVTATYAKSKYPFGSVVSADGFKRGLVRSGTDYSVFTEELGMRGLDVAYMEPRSRYHTDQDDTKDTSPGSVWHMLSMALATTTELASQDWDQDSSDSGVWFDVFGTVFAVLRTHVFFALCVTLLVVGPVSLAIVELLLKRKGKWYPFSFKTYMHGEDDDEPVRLYGLRGFFRFPIAFIASSAAVVALAYLVTKINPYIIYSSPYVVWSMMLATHLAISWFLLCLFAAIRPSVLSRLFTLLWLYVVTWLLLLAAAVASARLDLGGLYFVLVFNLTVLLALHISYLDLFALPSKAQFAAHVTVGATRRPSHDPSHDPPPQTSSRPTSSRAANQTEDPTERTSLLSPTSTRPRDRQTFARYNQRRSSHDPSIATAEEAEEDSRPDLASHPPYESEQAWSGLIPKWTWIIQVLLLLPLNLILIGQIALLLTSALAQTPADGSEVLTIYLFIASLAILLLIPSYTVLNRVMWQLPTILFLVAVGTTLCSLLGAPFTRDARLKVFFVQRVNLDTGRSTAALNGLPGYVEQVVAELPSSLLGEAAACHDVEIPSHPTYANSTADDDLTWAARRGLRTCAWPGLTPSPLQHWHNSSPPTTDSGRGRHNSSVPMKDWIRFSATSLASTLPARERSPSAAAPSFSSYLLTLSGLNTRVCRLYFDPTRGHRIANLTVLNACPDLASPGGRGHNGTRAADCPRGTPAATRHVAAAAAGNRQVRLWSRTFEPEFRIVVDVEATRDDDEEADAASAKVKGLAMCVWSDANVKGAIPALDELVQYAPVWAAISKNGDGLVEGYKEFEL